jgi:hypothetical protein
MNDEFATCDVCGADAYPRGWLRCMLCGNRFHFATAGEGAEHDCGVVAPNPQSENGC